MPGIQNDGFSFQMGICHDGKGVTGIPGNRSRIGSQLGVLFRVTLR